LLSRPADTFCDDTNPTREFVKIRTFGSIIAGTLFERSVRQHYWEVCASLAMMGRLFRPANREFCRVVLWDQMRFLFDAVRPVEEETVERARAAVDWLLRAQGVTGDAGVSYGYFPCSPENNSGWRPSYPETTGYIIP